MGGFRLPQEAEDRLLAEQDNTDYFTDANGDEYDPYSLAWRYLGMYIDCDFEESELETDDLQRRLESGDDACYRKILWAAVGSL